MRRLHKATARGFDSVPSAIRQQPSYDTELSDAYFQEMTRRIDAAKPDNFHLTPISEPGW